MKKRILVCLLAVGIINAAFAQVKNPNTKVLSYYFGNAAGLDNYDPAQMTHIIFCFGKELIKNRYTITKNDSLTIQKMVSMKKRNPQLKVLLSLGGGGYCLNCSSSFSTDAGRKEFVQSVKEHLTYFGADGIDLDWEFPSYQSRANMEYSPDDLKNFTALVKELKTMGPQYMVTFAVGAHKGIFEERTDFKEVMKYADLVNLMTYDIGIYPPSAGISDFATRTAKNPEFRPNAHHTALYSTPQQERSVDFCVKYLLNLGIPPEKIVVGAAFYGKAYTSASDENHGLYQAGKAITPFAGHNFKEDFNKTLSPDSGWVKYWDETAQVPYAYNATKKIFFTYEDKRSVALKTQYVIDHKLGGIMFWDLSKDTSKDGLLSAINDVKNTYTSKK